MLALVYIVLSAIAFLSFSLAIQNQTIVQTHIRTQTPSPNILKQVNKPAPINQITLSFPISTPSATPKLTPQATPISKPITPSPTPLITPVQYAGAGYVVTPAEKEGFFNMANAPIEPMSTVGELNQAVNEFRRAHGQGDLEVDQGLCGFADRRAHEIGEEFSHDGFKKYFEGENIETWGFSHFGENIWRGSLSGVHIVEYGWAKSPAHYEALVGSWTKGCAGIYETNAVFIFAR